MTKRFGWARCFLVLALNAGILGVCIWGALSSGSLRVALLVAGISLPFHVALGILTLSMRRGATEVRRLYEIDSGELPVLWRDGDQFANALRDAGRMVQRDPDGDDAGLNNAAFVYVQRRLIAHEGLLLDGLCEALLAHIEDMLEPLLRLELMAFGVGLSGTVAGLGLQVYIAQETARGGILAQSFLMGVVVKAGTTLTGIIVAGYCRGMRWRLRRALGRLADALEQFAAVRVAPLFHSGGASATAGSALSLDDLRSALMQMAKVLGDRLEDAVREARRLLTEFAVQDLASAIRVNVAEPLQRELTASGGDMRRAAAGLETSAAALRDAVEDFGRRLSTAIADVAQINNQIGVSSTAVTGMASAFVRIVEQAQSAGTLMLQCAGELDAAIGNAQLRGDGRAVEQQFLAAVSDAAHVIRASSGSLERAMGKLAEMAGRSNHGAAGGPL